MIALIAIAFADPVILRAPVHAAGLTAGLHDVSAGATWGDVASVAVEASTSGASAGASVGGRWFYGRPGGDARLQGGLSGGLLVPLVEPGVAVSATAWAHGGWIGDRGHFVAGAAAPLAVGTAGLRLPLLLELQGGLRAGRVLVGARLSAGPVLTPGTDVSVWLEPALTAQILPSTRWATEGIP